MKKVNVHIKEWLVTTAVMNMHLFLKVSNTYRLVNFVDLF